MPLKCLLLIKIMMEINFRLKHTIKLLWVALLVLPIFAYSQVSGDLYGVVKSEANEKMPFCTVYLLETRQTTQTGAKGDYLLKDIPYGDYTLIFQFVGYEKQEKQVVISSPKQRINIVLKQQLEELATFEVKEGRDGTGGMARMRSIEGVTISEGKKTEVIRLSTINANKATNQGRQIYSRIPGLNIWESDGAGLQLGIGGRGLDPNRTSNFNTRQNGYDISAD